MDPSVALPWLQAASPILGKVLGGGAPAGPSAAYSQSSSNNAFDTSAWTVATGKSDASAQVIPWAWLIAGGVVALVVWRRGK